MKITKMLSVMVLATIVSSAAFADTRCLEEISAMESVASEVMVQAIFTEEREVYQSIFDAQTSRESEKAYFLAKALTTSYITVKVRWDGDNGGGTVLNILDSKNCRQVGQLSLSRW